MRRWAFVGLLAGCFGNPNYAPGTVEVDSVQGPGNTLSQAIVQFPDTYESDTGCTHPLTVGPCRLLQCDPPMVAPAQKHYNAGPVEIQVKSNAVANLTFSGDQYTTRAAVPPAPLWQRGDEVALVISGASTTTRLPVAAPGAAKVTSPNFRDGYSHDFSTPLMLTWDNGNAGEEIVLHFANSLICKLPSAPGAGMIPAEALVTIPTTGSPISGYTASEAQEFVGVYNVTLRAQSDLYGSDGSELIGGKLLRK